MGPPRPSDAWRRALVDTVDHEALTVAFFRQSSHPDRPAARAGGAAGAAAAVEDRPREPAAACAAVGQRLVEQGSLSPGDLADALDRADGDLLAFVRIVVAHHRVAPAALLDPIAAVTGVPAADARSMERSGEVSGVLPEAVARSHAAIAVGEVDGSLLVLAAAPTSEHRRAVEAGLERPPTWRVADLATVTAFLDRTYRADAQISRLVGSLELTDEQARRAALAGEVDLDDQAPIIQLVNRIVSQALRDRASDVHMEPLDDRLRIRFRIDGHLVESFSLPLRAHAALTSRLKIMSGMNIVERRRPQDGQFSTLVDGREVDVRVGTVSTVLGEKLVMRILDKSRSTIGLAQLGFSPAAYATYAKMIHAPFGMVICAGPTGAGKTTTLYASLLEINSAGKNITTVEDPVEYVFPGINQIQTNDQAGLTFATGLKAILRQDPDVILVGEIRDVDTARIAVQSALTGHFVLSSLHAIDSVAALHRVLDMGVEAFLIASSVLGVVGQRLLRRICASCTTAYTPPPDELEVFRQHSHGADKQVFFHGTGCVNCAGTGYRDRIGVYELLAITPELRRLIVARATAEELRALAASQGMRTMLEEAMALVAADVTTVQEAVRNLFSS